MTNISGSYGDFNIELIAPLGGGGRGMVAFHGYVSQESIDRLIKVLKLQKDTYLRDSEIFLRFQLFFKAIVFISNPILGAILL